MHALDDKRSETLSPGRIMAWKWLSLQQMRKYWVPIDICKPLMKEGHNDLNLKVKIDPVESAFQLNCFSKKLAIETICKYCSRYYNFQDIVDFPQETDQVTYY